MSDTAILEELRERYEYATDAWREIREEAAIDMRYMAGDCFALDPDARQKREDAHRPIVDPDELSQYVNQLINDTRQNKRGVKVTPKGNGANDATAAFRQGKIRDVEYTSNAQQAYAVMAENCFQMSYGFLRIVPHYCDDESDEQELCIEPVPNATQVTPDPDHKRTDGRDLKYLFYEESRTVKEFRREFPDAEITDFGSSAVQQLAPTWVNGKQVRIAEYWTKQTGRRRTRYTLKPGPASAQDPRPQPRRVFHDELKTKPSSDQILSSREIAEEHVVQYLTNGIEILKTTAWPGKSIPWVTCYGKILFVDGKKVILSLIRLARSPQMLYAYYRTQQAEMAGMIPKVPVVGYKGQFSGMESDWERSPNEPLAFIEVNPTTPATGQQVLALPQRLPYDAGAQLQALEMCAEGARRAIQAAIGINPMPTAAQRQNEKSGKALERMEATAQKGSFHFTDHYDEGIARTGAILDELVPHYYDTARETSIRKPDDSPEMVTINTPTGTDGAGAPAWGKDDIRTDVGAHDVTISVGPAEESERDAASDFADSLAQSQLFPMIADLVVKLKNLGPIGDEIADRLTPPQFRKQPDGQEPLPPAAQQAMAQAHQQIQQLGQQLQQAVEEIRTEKAKQQAMLEKAKVDGDTQLRLQTIKNAALIAVAKINALTKGVVVAQEGHDEAIALAETQAHEAEQNALDRAHDVGLAVQGQAHALQKGAQSADAAAALADQGHGQALEMQAAQPPPAGDSGAPA